MSIILFFSACKSKKDTWLRRKYQNTTARYNSYYHGKKIIKETIEDGRKIYKDDFDEIVDLYAYGTEESLKSNIANMDKIQKKAAFLIKAKKKSKWIDDTYFLVGQSYFFKGDLDAAISTFQYVSSTYKKNLKLRYDAQVWIVKSYLMQGKLLDAESAITNLINDTRFYEKSKPELHLVAGAVLSKLGKNVEAIKYINLALKKIKDKESKRRMHYALGQLYTKTEKYTLAAKSFKKVTKMNPPYEFNFRSKLNIVDLLGKSKGASYKRRKRILNRMLKDDKNLDNLDVVYSYLAKLELSQGNTKKALEYFTLSAGKSTKNKGQKVASYEEIANYYYKEGRYVDAKKYYDSAQQLLGQLEANVAKKYEKGDNFNNLLDHLVRIQREDSLLSLSNNPLKLEQVIDRLVKNEKDREEQLKSQKELKSNFIPQKLDVPGMNNNSVSLSSFPFYNTVQREKGFANFVKRWGKRSLVDNWRIYSMSGYDNSTGPRDHTIKPPKDSIKDTEAPINVKEERKKYYKDIPFTAEEKRNSLANIEESLFEAGKIYMEMDRIDDAVIKFNRILKEYPKSNYTEGVLFYLYKIYNKTDTKKANKYKEKLERLFPKSRFLDIIYGKKTDGSEKASQEITELYLKAYKTYSASNYNKTIAYKKEHDLRFAGSPMQIKFDYLAALSLAKMGKKAEAKALLIQIKDNWPTTKIGKRSAEHIVAMEGGKKEKIKKAEFSYLLDKEMEHLYVAIIDGAVNEQKIKIAIADFNATNYSLKKVYVVTSVIDDAHKAIIIKGFDDTKECLKYKELISSMLDLKQKFNLTTHHSLIINKKNLSTLLKTKKVKEYVKFFGENY